MRTLILGAAVSALLFSSFASANYYKKGNQVCEDFKEAENLYKADPEAVYAEFGYARCLVIKGEDATGMNILYRLRDYKNSVAAARMIAKYIQSGGTFEATFDDQSYDEALEAHFKVLALINSDPSYPHNGHRIYEFRLKMELNSYLYIPALYLSKFKHGAYGSYAQKLLQSPTYKGDRDKKTYPEYAPYTIDSLRRLIEHARGCASLRKKVTFGPRSIKPPHSPANSIKN